MSNQHKWDDLRYIKIPKKYGLPPNQPTKKAERGRYWDDVLRRYNDTCKWIQSQDYHWYVLTFTDGRKELAFLRIRKRRWSEVICRGLIIPRLLSTIQYASISDIRLAF